MIEPKQEFPSDAPYGTRPRRPTRLLVMLIVLFAVWFGFLIWMAVRYPAH